MGCKAKKQNNPARLHDKSNFKFNFKLEQIMTNELNQNWLQAGSLLYALNNDINCYEISVTQVAGSRDMNARAAFTTKLQNMLATHTAVDDATQRDAERYRYWRNKYSEKFGDADLTPEDFDRVTDAQMLMASANELESALTQPVVIGVSFWRPIATAPKDGRLVLVNDYFLYEGAICTNFVAVKWVPCYRWSGWVYDDEALQEARPEGPKAQFWFDVPPPPSPAQTEAV